MKTAGYVLAGGRSTRMGRDKALLILDGETLVQRALRTLAEVCDEVAIAGGAPHLAQFGRLIPDPIPDSGPLAGIVAALEQSTHEWNLFLAVDVPFVPREAWLQILAVASQIQAGDYPVSSDATVVTVASAPEAIAVASAIEIGPGFSPDIPGPPQNRALAPGTCSLARKHDYHPQAIAIMARVRNEIQPLCSAYRRSAAPALRRQLESGNLKVTRAVEAAGPIAYVDFENINWFRNFNTPAEFEQAAAFPGQL
jgi:molybdopterin-guanine dinucleotide biosynthesis protein A